MPRMRNNFGQRIDPRTGQPYDGESRPVPHHTRSDPEPRHTPLSHPSQGLEEHFLLSDFRRTEGAVTPSLVSSRASQSDARTPEVDTA